MIAVAVVAILAVIAIPAFFSQSRKSKASSETSAMMAEMSTKEEQYKIDNAAYRTTATCPTSVTSQQQSFATCLAGSDWSALHINPPETKGYCQYTITAGSAGASPSPTSPFHMASDGSDAVAQSWFYIIAACDMDGDGSANGLYFMSSVDTKIQTQNEGK